MKSKYKGIIYIIIAAFCFATMTTFVRLSGDLPSAQKCFFRNLVALVFASIILMKNNISILPKKGNLELLILRSALGTLGIIGNFYAVDHMLLSDANILNKMSPFFAIICSYFLLKEKVNKVEVTAIIGALIGCLFIIKPTGKWDMFPAIMGLLGGISAGAAYTMVRKLGQREEQGAYIVFFFSIFSCLCLLPMLLVTYVPMTQIQLIYLLLAGLAAAGGQFAVTAAYYHAPAKEISVFDYSQVIFSAIFGFLLFGQVPDKFSVLGYILICAMAIYMFLYNTGKLKKIKS